MKKNLVPEIVTALNAVSRARNSVPPAITDELEELNLLHDIRQKLDDVDERLRGLRSLAQTLASYGAPD